MTDDTSKNNTLITIKTDVKRIDDTVRYHQQSLDKKVTKDVFKSEIEHLSNKVTDLKEDIRDTEKRLAEIPPHRCVSSGRIEDTREQVMEMDRALRRLYIWQAGIGISLLLCCLTIGVAALTYVNRMDFAVQKNTESINLILRKLDKQEDEEKKDLKQAIKESSH